LDIASKEKLEFECRKCGQKVSPDKINSLRFCPKCGTVLQLRPQPKHWLFQFNPLAYGWLDRIKSTQEPEQWLVSQHSKLIHTGDLVAIWAAGQKSGIYAIGQIMTNPGKKSLNHEQEKYFSEEDAILKFQENPSAMVKYLKILVETPLLQKDCHQDSLLCDLQVFINPRGTNFRLTTEQWNRIMELTE
jgi:predicted RNA-binding Zn-ribbon protein involved in translation (DUF1610 family)